jgi:AraC-like DNA-binding protein
VIWWATICSTKKPNEKIHKQYYDFFVACPRSCWRICSESAPALVQSSHHPNGITVTSMNRTRGGSAVYATACHTSNEASELLKTIASFATAQRPHALMHPAAVLVFSATLRLATTRPNVSSVANALSTSKRNLERRFAKAGLPAAHRLVVLTRWVPVAAVLSTCGPTTTEIARVLGFDSAQSLCRSARRELQRSVRELRAQDAAARIVADLVTAYQAPTR